MKVPVAFFDANVLYSRTLCDWFFMLRLELPGLFLLYTSQDVIDEVVYNIRRDSPRADGSLTERKRKHLVEFMDDVVRDFSGNVPFSGDDVHDHHVHAAAVTCRAHYLVSDDRGFASLNADEAPYEAHTADSFLCLIAENAPYAVQAVITRQLAYWGARPGSKSLSAALREAGAPIFADRIELAVRAMSEGRSVHGVLIADSSGVTGA